MALTRDELTQGFRRLGLEAGDAVVVHSSLRSLGPVDGGADAVIDALLSAVGPRGNLVLPTFNYSSPLPEPHYDPATTPCRTGALPEVGRRRAEALRSLHPTHSVAAIGRDADELTRDHLDGRAFGPASPLDRLAQRGGKVLLLGVAHTSNSTVHVAEEHARVPKADRWSPMPVARLRLPDGRVIEHRLDSSPSCSAAFEAAALPLRRAGVIRDGRVAMCLMQLMRGLDVIETLGALLREEPAALLCSNPDCASCQGVRRNLA